VEGGEGDKRGKQGVEVAETLPSMVSRSRLRSELQRTKKKKRNEDDGKKKGRRRDSSRRCGGGGCWGRKWRREKGRGRTVQQSRVWWSVVESERGNGRSTE
jgi:hypothetical protein